VKVLFMTRWYPTPEFSYGGVFVREHAKAVAREHQVTVLHCEGLRDGSSSGFEEDTDPELTEGIPTFRVWHRRLPVPRSSYALYLATALNAFQRLRARGLAPEVIHAHIFDAGVPAALVGRLYGIPVVLTEQYSGFPLRTVRGVDAWKARFAFRGARRVLPVSDFLRRALEPYGLRATAEIVPNVFDPAIFFPLEQRPGDTVRLLIVGHLDEQHVKGFPTLAEALRRLPTNADWHLDVIGTGPARAGYEERLAATNLLERVTFHGALPKPAVAEAMRRANVFVLPSRYDNMPCVVVEALGSGLPVVATRVGGIPEMVREGDGALVPPSDPEALAEALLPFISRSEEHDSEAIAERARARYGADTVAAQLTRIYEEVV